MSVLTAICGKRNHFEEEIYHLNAKRRHHFEEAEEEIYHLNAKRRHHFEESEEEIYHLNAKRRRCDRVRSPGYVSFSTSSIPSPRSPTTAPAASLNSTNTIDDRISHFKALFPDLDHLLQSIQKENSVLKERLESFGRDNQILKRAVAIQNERLAEHAHCSQEVQQLKQTVSQYQEHVRALELNNYALKTHLKRAEEGSSMPKSFHPDVF